MRFISNLSDSTCNPPGRRAVWHCSRGEISGTMCSPTSGLNPNYHSLLCRWSIHKEQATSYFDPQYLKGLVTLFSRITKLGWFDSEKEEFVFRAVITDVTKFLQVQQTIYVISSIVNRQFSKSSYLLPFLYREVLHIAWWVFSCSHSWLVRWIRYFGPFE